METCKVSVIIPAYNIEKYLPRCLDSVLAQTYDNIEVIVVNDGSKDETGRVIDEYAEKDNRVIAIHKENGGVSSARLAGIKAANGDYIGFVDGDDYIEPDMYERLVSNAIKHNADISHCGYKMVFPKGHIDYYYNTGKFLVQDNFIGLKDLIEGIFIEPGLVNKLYKKTIVDLFIENDDMDYSVKINEDLLMNYYLFKASKCSVYEDFCPYQYTLRKGSAAITKNSNHLTDPICIRKKIYDDTVQNNNLAPYSFPLYIRSLVSACGQKKFADIRNNARADLKSELKNKANVLYLPKKLRLMAKLAAFSPWGYRTFRFLTDRIRGVDNKYSLDK